MTTPPPSLPQLAVEFAARARTAGHPVLAVAPGRWNGAGHPTLGRSLPLGDLLPNDLLDAVRDVARSRTDWVHAVLPTATDAVRLAAAVHPASKLPRRARTERAPWRDLLRRATGAGHHGAPGGVPLERLLAEVPPTVITLTEHQDGRAVHVVEIPAAWLTHPLAEVTR